jgi:hypothetical protein
VIDGRPVEKRDGTPRSNNHLPPLRLSVCDEKTGNGCNQELSRRFEQDTTKTAVKAMFELDVLDEAAIRVAAAWWLKTTLLAHHPETTSTGGPTPPVWPPPVDRELYSWLIDGSVPPAGLSMWLAVADVSASGRSARATSSEAHFDHLAYEVEGRPIRSHSADFGLGQLRVHLLAHPGFEMTHPVEETGKAIRLHPWAGGNLDMSSILRLDSSTEHAWHHLWGSPVRLLLDEDFDPRSAPWLLGPGWTSTLPFGLRGVRGAMA